MIYKILYIALLFVFISNSVYSQPECENDTLESTRIYFANGMSNRRWQADESSEAIRFLLNFSTSNAYRTSYNQNENWFAQLLEVYRQKKSDEEQPRDFWHWMRNMDEAPEWFQAVYQESMDQFQQSSVYYDPDLMEHVNNYVQDLYNGKRVVIVGHSQGNFYANNAYRRILNEHPEYAHNIGIVGVATPANSVLGWNNRNRNFPYDLYYTTNDSDLIINLVRAYYSDTLPPNPSEGYSNSFFNTNHGFVDTYLDANGPFRKRIHDQIIQTISLVEKPEKAPECQDASVETLTPTNISTTSVQLNGMVVTGKDVYGDFIIKPSYEDAPLSCYDLSLPTSGTWKAGDQFSRFVAVKPETTYYYRACGKSGDVISSGSIAAFTTPNVPCTPLNTSGGTNGLNFPQTMGSKAGYVLVEFEPYDVPDKLEIYQGQTLKVRTPGYVDQCNYATVYHDPDKGLVWDIRVYGNSITSTEWNLHITCPKSSKPTDSDFILCSP